MIFLSAGHHSKKAIGADPGAINSKGIKEGDITIEFRDLVSKELKSMGIDHKLDSDQETLSQYVDRIQTGNASVVCEYHLNAATPQATGTETIVEIDADKDDLDYAKELTESTSKILNIRNRGVFDEGKTRHKRLYLMKENGIVVLHEICFITNENDMNAYQSKKNELAKAHAQILAKYESKIN